MVNTECVSRLLVSDSLSYKPARLLLSVEFSEEEYWSGLPFPSPGNLSDPGIELGSSASQADSLPFEHKGNTEYGKSKSLFKEFFFLKVDT